MWVKFYGVRGSIASAGPTTARYGGNTSCVYIEVGSQRLIFDAGTGIRLLGEEWMDRALDAHLFLSHLHWDHIQGFPFFAPAFRPGNALQIHGVCAAGAVSPREVLTRQMHAPTFPVPIDIMKADLCFRDLRPEENVAIGDVEVRHTLVDHPNGCAAFRVDSDDASVVYATDLEHQPEPADNLVELCRGADLLIYDAMYTPEEYAGQNGCSRRGWGHSTFEAGAELAEAAGVKSLCLFHHDPSHDDAFLDALGERARARFRHTWVASEGLGLRL